MNRRSAPPPPPPGRRPATGGGAPGTVRIIGGHWRGTKLPVADLDGLRPTSDRVRETLFNWLQPMLPGARVLDLFAGSGALGLEAVSRGAREAVLVERDPTLAANLRQIAARLPDGDRVQVVSADAVAWMRDAPGEFDLAFVDPPFAANLWQPALDAVASRMAADAWLYVEAPHDAAADPGPGWRPHREGKTRDVRFAVYRRDA
ncbi:MAG: 16S rRNA (guanine(966)-N(2))-methyltransferase RsmD [Xanthomonadaceae bacterium]|nr:16S rRNA (guanine(966)-N(2))-methyltransferase RsmD [Xanthomonadaceae bacterium]